MTQVLEAKERKDEDVRKILHPLVSEWFFGKFKELSLTQKYGVLNIWERKDILISAPTGGTKTLTSFLSIINYLVGLAADGNLDDRVVAVYTSPLKALSNDIHKNLIEPLEEIKEISKKNKVKLQDIRVGLRTGDTSTSDKAKMARKSPHILVTTPESLAIVLTSKKFVEKMANVEFCIIDEIHSMDNKRGTYLSLTLERLNEVSGTWPTKIGLSATVEPLDDVARYLVGESDDREVRIAKVPLQKKIDVQVLTPVDNLIEEIDINAKLYERISDLVQEHETTLIFTNTRAATERVVNHLKDRFPTEYGDDNIAAHHSSMSKDSRFDIEERLRDGKLKCVVCSTSLELGIDIGFIDLVLMLGSPKSSARALQRLGRAGHQLHEVAKGRFIVLDRDDLVECCVIQKEMIEKKINKIQFPTNCLDVLSQQIYGMAIYKIWKEDEIFNLIKKSYCYKDLSRSDFLDVISYLSGEYNLEGSFVYGKIWYDPETKEIGKKGKMARVLYLTNIGTIPDESFVKVKTSSDTQIGAIAEGFLERMKKGDVFVLGGKKYVYKYTKGMNLYVQPTVTRSPTIPSWFSEMLPLSFDSANEVNRFRTLMKSYFEQKRPKKEITNFVKEHLYVQDETAEVIYNYFREQNGFLQIPGQDQILVEKYKSEKNYLIFHASYGRRVNDVLSRVIGLLVSRNGGRDIEIGISDRGFYLAGEKMNLDKAVKALKEEDLIEMVKESIEKTDILMRRFRHCASRSLMILRNYKGQTKTVGKQQMKSHFLMAAVRKMTSEFPILREARREVMEDLMDIKNAEKIVSKIKEDKIPFEVVDTILPSPFALSLIIQGHTDLIKMEDKQAFLRRMHELHTKNLKD